MTRITEHIDVPVDIFGIDPRYLDNPTLVADDEEILNIFSQEFAAVAGLAAHGAYYLRFRDKLSFLDSNKVYRYVEPRLPKRKQTTELHKQFYRIVIALSGVVDLLLITNTQYTINSQPNTNPIQLTQHAIRWRNHAKPSSYYPKYDFSDPQNLPNIGAAVPGNLLSFLKENKPNPSYLEVYQAILSKTETALSLSKPDPLLLSSFICRGSKELERCRQFFTAFLNSLVLVNLPITKVYSPGFDYRSRENLILRLLNISTTVIEDINKASILNRLAESIFTGNYTDSDIELLLKLLSVDVQLFTETNLKNQLINSKELLDRLVVSYIDVLKPTETLQDLIHIYIQESTKLDGALGIPGNYVAAGAVHVLKALFILNDLTQGIIDTDAFYAAVQILIQGIKFIGESKLQQFNIIIAQLVAILNSLEKMDIRVLADESNSKFLRLKSAFKI